MTQTPLHKQNTAEAMKALEHILGRPVSIRPTPLIGERTSPSYCPSATPDKARAMVPLAGGGVRPAGLCAQKKCLHWSNGCTLGSAVAVVGRAVRKLSGTTGQTCDLAEQCRWFAENGIDSCLLCPHLRREDVAVLAEEILGAAR